MQLWQPISALVASRGGMRLGPCYRVRWRSFQLFTSDTEWGCFAVCCRLLAGGPRTGSQLSPHVPPSADPQPYGSLGRRPWQLSPECGARDLQPLRAASGWVDFRIEAPDPLDCAH